ncbi:MAG: hypothetical protein ACI9DC_005567 [Gammaproteobacteria bacterium]|jgi:hypothetical protein
MKMRERKNKRGKDQMEDRRDPSAEPDRRMAEQQPDDDAQHRTTHVDPTCSAKKMSGTPIWRRRATRHATTNITTRISNSLDSKTG